MFTQVVTLAGIALVSLMTVGVLFLLGMRTKSPLVLRAVIALCRAFMNPRQMRTAGQPGAYAGIIRHRGRVSGRSYETPVGVVPTDDGFLIMLPYGRASWTRNVLAAGSAVLVHEGATVKVSDPEVIPLASVAESFSASDQRMARLFRVTEALSLRRADAVRGDVGATPAVALPTAA